MNSIWILIGITGLAVIVHEFFLKKYVTPKENRLFFCFLLLVHGLVFLNFSLPHELIFKGDLSVIDLQRYASVIPSVEAMEVQMTDLIIPVYLVGVVFGLIKLILGFVRLMRLKSKSVPGRNKFERRVKSDNFRPFTFFKYLFIPVDLPKDVYYSVYYHEKYHAEQWHSLDMLFWHLISIAFWFNPFVHILNSRQAQNLEYDTDEQLIKVIPQKLYSKHLLNAVFESPAYDFNPMFNKSKIFLRMKRLNQNRTKRGFKSSIALIFTISLLFGGLILTKASLGSQKDNSATFQMSKPEFKPHGHEHYIDSVLQVKLSNKFDNINPNFNLHLFLDITINKNGNVTRVKENSPKTSRSGDKSTNDFLSGLLIETIEEMPKWVPAKQNGVNVASTIQEEFHFSGEGE